MEDSNPAYDGVGDVVLKQTYILTHVKKEGAWQFGVWRVLQAVAAHRNVQSVYFLLNPWRVVIHSVDASQSAALRLQAICFEVHWRGIGVGSSSRKTW